MTARLLHLQHTFACPDEKLCPGLGGNLYWRHFRGATYFRLAAPIGLSSLTRWRPKVAFKSLRTLLGRVWRDIDRKLARGDETTALRAEPILMRVRRMFAQVSKDKNTHYSLHAV